MPILDHQGLEEECFDAYPNQIRPNHLDNLASWMALEERNINWLDDTAAPTGLEFNILDEDYMHKLGAHPFFKFLQNADRDFLASFLCELAQRPCLVPMYRKLFHEEKNIEVQRLLSSFVEKTMEPSYREKYFEDLLDSVLSKASIKLELNIQLSNIHLPFYYGYYQSPPFLLGALYFYEQFMGQVLAPTLKMVFKNSGIDSSGLKYFDLWSAQALWKMKKWKKVLRLSTILCEKQSSNLTQFNLGAQFMERGWGLYLDNHLDLNSKTETSESSILQWFPPLKLI
ncbi:MAG: hypothetical protein HOE90_24225 [Bacteriovoracaceae bacterium]|nr:hypothetical protein [Bacteriovoracaceae bacterium]